MMQKPAGLLSLLPPDRKKSLLVWPCIAMLGGFIFCTGSGAQDSQPTVSEKPKWVAEVLSETEPLSSSAIVTGRHASHGAARDELRQLLVSKVDRWLKTQPESERLRLTRVDWEIVGSLVSPGDLWVGQVEAETNGESANHPWIGLARVELKNSLLEKAESLVISRSILSRVETAMLALAAAAGTVCIVWFSLLLDHKTRHHFSRRFQMLGALLWIAMGVAVFFVWRMVLT